MIYFMLYILGVTASRYAIFSRKFTCYTFATTMYAIFYATVFLPTHVFNGLQMHIADFF